jgi:hypothetical protein
MYNWHACIELADSTDESNIVRTDELSAELCRKISALRLYCVPEQPVVRVNGMRLFQCSGSHNHRGDAHIRLLEIVEWIAEVLPGSHGLVYWYDDEMPGRTIFDGYNVIVIARGGVVHRYDPFLSPRAPTVED